MDERDELLEDEVPHPMLTQNISKQSLNAWQNNASRENLQIVDEDGNEYETLLELKNKQK